MRNLLARTNRKLDFQFYFIYLDQVAFLSIHLPYTRHLCIALNS